MTQQTDRILQNLTEAFKEGHRLVWWQDPEQEFADYVAELSLEGVQVVPLGQEPALSLKKTLELDAADQAFLLYEPGLPPEPEDDWLLDIRFYAKPFSADKTALLMQALGITQHSLREHLKERGRFFANKERTERLKQRLAEDDDATSLDVKMMAVLLRCDQSEWLAVLMHLLTRLADEEAPDNSDTWRTLEKYQLADTFWQRVKTTFGYHEATPSLERFLIRLFASDLGHQLQNHLPESLAGVQLPSPMRPNVAVFLAKWRDSNQYSAGYDRLSDRLAQQLSLEAALTAVELDPLLDVHTFAVVEKIIAAHLRDRLLSHEPGVQLDTERGIAARRQDGYWANQRRSQHPDDTRAVYHHYYQSVIAASELMELRYQWQNRLSFADAKACFTAYSQELFRLDQKYRQYHVAAAPVEGKSSEVLAQLTQRVEDLYLQGYLQPLAQAWDGFMGQGLLDSWRLSGIPVQYEFYQTFVAPKLKEADARRVFVFISDALRYEVAEELESTLNQRNYVVAELSAQLGVLPSYTALGMASLLPHSQLSYTDKGDVLADGQSTSGLEARKKILAQHNGLAIKYSDYMALRKDEGRELIKPYQVVYVYHDSIDAVGDKQATEGATFEAATQAISELADAVSRSVNNYGASTLFITADHGFLYRESSLDSTDKHVLDVKPSQASISKKRYIIGQGLGSSDQVWHGRTQHTAGTSDATEFWVPKGMNRFHFVGGARFVHGGASLQEICVPVIRVSHERGKNRSQTTSRKATVTVLGNNLKITTNQYRFTLLQTEAVAERIKPITVKIGLYAGDEAVSNVETATFDSDSDDMNQRQRTVMLTLLSRAFSNKETYHLTLTDADTGIEHYRTAVRIDLAFTNDFDF